MSALEELAAHCEAAEGADRNLDAMIHFRVTNGIGCGNWNDAPAYTASVDAALTLVPEGWNVDIGIYTDGSASCLLDDDRALPERLPNIEVEGQTPALAICAAALRARKVQP